MRKPNLNQLTDHPATDSMHDVSALQGELSAMEHALEDTVLRLSDYLSAVDMVIKQTFDHRVWVKAEIRNLSSKGGHYYFELAEKDDAGKVVASCRGTLWRSLAPRVLQKFERGAGMTLARDLTVLLKVSARFHPQYGFSLNIEDIDPSYTLGDLAQQYAAILERLSGEGLLERNKALPAPFDIEHVLVIAPEKAAGLGDFRADADRLMRHGACQFHYHHATFQGNHAHAEIRQAIISAQQQFAASHACAPDLLVIIRGGGAVGDLAYLNDYELAALVAELPMPVWVGIGHERDRVMLDEVAHHSFDTPSKVIAAIVTHLSTLIHQTLQYQAQIWHAAQQQLYVARQQTARSLAHIQASSQGTLTAVQKDCYYAWQTTEHSARQQLKRARTTSSSHYQNIHDRSQQQLRRTRQHIRDTQQHVNTHAYQQLASARANSRHLRDIVLLHQPTHLLQKGYALLQRDARYISSVDDVTPEDTVTIRLQDGQLRARVTDIIRPDETTS
ncbi:exodeoxyribonuclease VII large subunit [Psychrobacter aestuarii]|nr:exodeoxyribonuclease VII large subunit [Psychrobacter aestuarii]